MAVFTLDLFDPFPMMAIRAISHERFAVISRGEWQSEHFCPLPAMWVSWENLVSLKDTARFSIPT
jgi:hypothetical protein